MKFNYVFFSPMFFFSSLPFLFRLATKLGLSSWCMASLILLESKMRNAAVLALSKLWRSDCLDALLSLSCSSRVKLDSY